MIICFDTLAAELYRLPSPGEGLGVGSWGEGLNYLTVMWKHFCFFSYFT